MYKIQNIRNVPLSLALCVEIRRKQTVRAATYLELLCFIYSLIKNIFAQHIYGIQRAHSHTQSASRSLPLSRSRNMNGV